MNFSFLEISRVAQLHRCGGVELEITRGDFQRYWKGVKERTSSSMSGQHFGHYKSAAHCDELSEFHAMFTQVVSSRGRPLRRWSVGLSAMLLKKAGVYLVSKLRAILLMEADFNFQNKLYIGSYNYRFALLQLLVVALRQCPARGTPIRLIEKVVSLQVAEEAGCCYYALCQAKACKH